MVRIYRGSFESIRHQIGEDLMRLSHEVEVPTWHAQDVRDNPMLVSYELSNVIIAMAMEWTKEEAQNHYNPQLPWAEDHFQERVGGKPLNPPPSASQWQTAGVADKHRTIEENGEMKYSHSYPERFWPKMAGRYAVLPEHAKGIRFAYGDLGDVVDLLRREPFTRQAYLPVWFPEDTGAHHRERVPCTLGYHFMIRDERLHMTYMIRSVDFVRHFPDDVYLAVRLAQWVSDQVSGECYPCPKDVSGGDGFCGLEKCPYCGSGHIRPSSFTMHMMSLHCFRGDLNRLGKEYGSHK